MGRAWRWTKSPVPRALCVSCLAACEDTAEAWVFSSLEGCCLFLYSKRLVIPSLACPSVNDPHISVMNPSQIKCNTCGTTNSAASFGCPLAPLLKALPWCSPMASSSRVSQVWGTVGVHSGFSVSAFPHVCVHLNE